MSVLVSDLKNEHAQLMKIFDSVSSLGVGSKEARTLLLGARRAFQEHLKKEGASFYPPLRKAAEKDEALRLTLQTFAADFDGIAGFVNQFFDRCADPNVDAFQLSKDFGKLVATLKTRMRREEEILYSAFDKVAG